MSFHRWFCLLSIIIGLVVRSYYLWRKDFEKYEYSSAMLVGPFTILLADLLPIKFLYVFVSIVGWLYYGVSVIFFIEKIKDKK
jgi:hypothetical protein